MRFRGESGKDDNGVTEAGRDVMIVRGCQLRYTRR